MEETHFKRLERVYRAARINQRLFENPGIEVSKRRADISLDVSPHYFHGMEAVHGSVLFKLLDDAAFFAVNSVVPDVFVITTAFQVHFVRPVTEGSMKAIGELRYMTRSHMVAEATVFNDQGKEVAFGTGSFTKSRFAIEEGE